MEILQLFNCRGERETTPRLEKATDTATSSIYAKTTLKNLCIFKGNFQAIICSKVCHFYKCFTMAKVEMGEIFGKENDRIWIFILNMIGIIEN